MGPELSTKFTELPKEHIQNMGDLLLPVMIWTGLRHGLLSQHTQPCTHTACARKRMAALLAKQAVQTMAYSSLMAKMRFIFPMKESFPSEELFQSNVLAQSARCFTRAHACTLPHWLVVKRAIGMGIPFLLAHIHITTCWQSFVLQPPMPIPNYNIPWCM
jgi:hypothetical protein